MHLLKKFARQLVIVFHSIHDGSVKWRRKQIMKHVLGKTKWALLSALVSVLICALLFVNCRAAEPGSRPKDEHDKAMQLFTPIYLLWFFI